MKTISIPELENYFTTEEHLCDFLEENLHLFSPAWLNEEIKEYKREWYFSNLKLFGSNKPHIDFFIQTKGNRRIGIEVKNIYKNASESAKAVSQLLRYGIIAEENNNTLDELILISSNFDAVTYKIIKKYNLPIRYLIVQRHKTYEAK